MPRVTVEFGKQGQRRVRFDPSRVVAIEGLADDGVACRALLDDQAEIVVPAGYDEVCNEVFGPDPAAEFIKAHSEPPKLSTELATDPPAGAPSSAAEAAAITAAPSCSACGSTVGPNLLPGQTCPACGAVVAPAPAVPS